jgi:transcriptional activator SPT7
MTDGPGPGPGPPPPALLNGHADDPSDEDPKAATFRALFSRADILLTDYLRDPSSLSSASTPLSQSSQSLAKSSAPAPKPTRTIDEDDYGDDDDDDDERPAILESSALQRSLSANGFGLSRPSTPSTSALSKPPLTKRPSAISEPAISSDDARKRLQQDKQAAEEAAKTHFHSLFHTLEFDHAAMLEQQKVDELDRQVEAEVSGDTRAKSVGLLTNGVQQGTLSSANLGASSLTLKHLLAMIDQNRSMVRAQDWQLRKLISEVRKNRSKWASEDKMGQEELYEAAEKVLQELKAMTEYSGPFLNRVNKREAPDYYSIIRQPMDIGTMMKKLKNFQYKSKKEFVDDLHLIWQNCLRYNTDPNHPLRKKALYMQKQTDSLTFLIPDITVRDRAEVEAEERKMSHLDAELDGIEDSDDEPIMASRGRAGPGKVAKKGNGSARKAPPQSFDGDTTPLATSSSNLRNHLLRADSDAPMEGIINGISTPPPGGTLTPIGVNGVMHSGASQADASDGDGFASTDLTQADEAEVADIELSTWKQVTKKARATAAAERSRLFINNRLNPDSTPLLRSKAGMRRFVRLEKQYFRDANSKTTESKTDDAPDVPGETLAEGVEAAEDDSMLPDYYDPICFIPEISEQLQWEDDEEGLVVNHAVDCFRVLPPGHFTAPDSPLNRKMAHNMRQMQETRKLCSKIGVVKQMQVQMQAFSVQASKYEPIPLHEADIPSHIVTDDGPVMAPDACRAAFQRTVGKVFYHAGFEDFHPSALETCTDVMADYFQRLVKTFAGYCFSPKAPATSAVQHGERYTVEEALLHTLQENSIDLESLEFYVTEDIERFGHKLTVMQDRMKAHLADQLVSVLCNFFLADQTASRSRPCPEHRQCSAVPRWQPAVRRRRLCGRHRRGLLRVPRARVGP